MCMVRLNNCMKYFDKFFSIRGFKRGYYVSKVFVPLHSKSVEIYSTLFNILKDVFHILEDVFHLLEDVCSVHNLKFCPPFIRINFEMSIQAVVKQNWTIIEIVGFRNKLC